MNHTLEYYLTKRYEVVTHSIAMIDHKNIELVGIPLTEINGEVYENQFTPSDKTWIELKKEYEKRSD